MIKRLHMVTNGRVIGYLDEIRGGALELVTPPLEDTARVSLAFAPSTKPVQRRKARAYIEGLLPDSEDARRAIATQFHVSANNPFALLSVIGRDCPGAIQFLSDEVMADLGAGGLEPVSEQDIGQRIRALRENSDQPWLGGHEHWSLAGAQSKFTLRRKDERWFVAHGAEPTTHIVKPGVRGLNKQALIEHVSLRTFQILGMPTAPSQYMLFDGEPAIVVARFDRVPTPDGQLLRAHQEDLCQATSTLPGAKYNVTAKDVVELLTLHGASGMDIITFVRSVLANWLIGAPDGHAKNYSVLLTPDDVALAPLYDVSTGLGYGADWPKVAMGIGGEKEFSRIRRHHVEKFAADLLGEALVDDVLEMAIQMARAIPDAFRIACDEVPVDPEGAAQLERTRRDVGAHCSRALAVLTGPA
ncbi:HipA domain-containing protein [Brachybacterium sp. GCM10030268]|uniref:HipA domain-containing protein n=1 Tax=Brachybacterium sp. GCM10030268 TaxID=3273382 RepID=UPI0036202F7B